VKNRMNKNVRNVLILGTVVVVAIVAALWAASVSWFPRYPYEPRPLPPSGYNRYDLQLFYTVETVVSAVNVTLSTILLFMYVSIYKKTRSEFTIGLMIFSAVFILHSVVSFPLLHQAFGFYPLGLGPFAMLPDLFTCVALVVLLYLTFEY
jgi:hypothetical protein